LRTELPRILAAPPDVLSPRMMRVIEGLAEDWRRLDRRVEELSREIKELANRDPACVRLMSVPGIGPIISSAMVAAIGTGFPRGATSPPGWGSCQQAMRFCGTEMALE
jgi:transposase